MSLVLKKENGIAILDASREKEVIAKVQSYLKDATLKEELAEAYETLMKVQRTIRKKEWIINRTNLLEGNPI